MLPALECISTPSFVNGTSFSLPYSSLEAAAAPIPVTYTNDPRVVHQWIDECLMNTHNPVVGFDVESVPTTPWLQNRVAFEGPATIQLATPHSCLVVHLTRRRDQTYSPCIKVLQQRVIGNADIVKVGVGIDQDILELYRFNKMFQGISRFDLGGVASSSSNRTTGLKSLVKAVLGIKLNKSRKLACSNWSRWPLTKAQLDYCARDAWAGAAVYCALQNNYRSTFAVSNIQSQLLQQERSVVDLDIRARKRKEAKTARKTLLQQYKIYAGLAETTNTRHLKFPPEIQREVDVLDEVIRETAPDKSLVFDEEFLGFTLNNN